MDLPTSDGDVEDGHVERLALRELQRLFQRRRRPNDLAI
jgi:hypothetical protein